MNTLAHLLTDYLVNSLWQAPLLFGIAWLVAQALRRLGPGAEHRVWVGALLAQVVLPACAAPGMLPLLRLLFSARSAGSGTVTVTLGAARAHGSLIAPSTLRAALLLYLCVTVVLLLRVLWQCVRLNKLSHLAVPLSLPDEAVAFLQACCHRLRVARVKLATAAMAETPLTFGLTRPVLVLPYGFAEQASSAQLQTSLAHELAHVARHDAAKHLFYRLASLAVAYHPAVWFTLASIAETRERVCDRMAAELTGDARQYARSLLELASLLTTQRPALSNAIGLFDANQFERRILMLNRRSLPVGRSLRTALVVGSVLVAGIACTSAVALHLNVTAPAAVGIAPQVKVSGGVMAGQVLSRVPPVYPEEAKKAKIQGAVVLRAIIGKTGDVEQLQVVSGPEELRAPSLDAVRRWVYKPFLLNGQPTEVETTIEVNFALTQ